MADELSAVDVTVLSEIINALNKLDPEARARMLQSVATLYGVSITPAGKSPSESGVPPPKVVSDVRPSFSEDRSQSPKDFLWEKQPKTAVERAICLAYYLSHNLGMHYFKTADITNLNMEAAQLKFSNPAWIVNEAARMGYLASAGGQNRQLTAVGEQFVRLLPDRQAALSATKEKRPKRRRKASNQKEKGSE